MGVGGGARARVRVAGGREGGRRMGEGYVQSWAHASPFLSLGS